MLQQIKSNQKHMDVANIILMVNPPEGNVVEKIILNPPYQRNVVWWTDQKASFIDSLLRGINSHHLVFNISEKGEYVCMDGKQRIISLVEYSQNKFPVTINDVSYYYNTIPVSIKKTYDYVTIRVLPDKDRSNFNKFPISIDKYDNLSYEQQVDVFNSLHKNYDLSRDGMMLVQFTTDIVVIIFNKYCNENKELFKKFVNIDRNEHYLLIIRLMYMVSKNIIKHPIPKQLETYIKSIKTLTNIKAELDKIDNLVKTCFSKLLLGNDSITSRLPMSYVIMICFGLHRILGNKLCDADKTIILSAIRKTHRHITSIDQERIKISSTMLENAEKLITKLKSYYKALLEEIIELSTSDEDEDEDEEDEEDEEVEEDEEDENTEGENVEVEAVDEDSEDEEDEDAEDEEDEDAEGEEDEDAEVEDVEEDEDAEEEDDENNNNDVVEEYEDAEVEEYEDAEDVEEEEDNENNNNDVIEEDYEYEAEVESEEENKIIIILPKIKKDINVKTIKYTVKITVNTQ